MENQIICPKCGSNQLSANKKGFSGKKAVAGAIVTGGIGLLAGTLGSNKIIITCLNCGHQFKPGEKPKPKATPEATAIGCGVLIVLFILFILIVKCASSTTTTTMPTDTDTPTPTQSTTPDNIPKKSMPYPNNYQIIQSSDDDQGNVNQLIIYVKRQSEIKSANDYLVNKYKTGNNVTLQIFYFDNKKIAKVYVQSLDDPNISDAEQDRMSNHMIGKYEWTGDGDGDLYIGKDAIDH